MKHFVVHLGFRDGVPPPGAMRAQRAFLATLLADGILVMAGLFTDERRGGMSILRAESLDAACERFSTSPLIEGGFVDWDLREWTVTTKKEGAI